MSRKASARQSVELSGSANTRAMARGMISNRPPDAMLRVAMVFATIRRSSVRPRAMLRAGVLLRARNDISGFLAPFDRAVCDRSPRSPWSTARPSESSIPLAIAPSRQLSVQVVCWYALMGSGRHLCAVARRVQLCPCRLEQGRTHGGVTTLHVDRLRETLPEAARDIQLNVRAVLQGRRALTRTRWGCRCRGGCGANAGAA
jgi:hypothetical protein